MAVHCTALAVGDIFAATCLSLVLVLLSLVVLYPVFFRLVWQPFRIRSAVNEKRRLLHEAHVSAGYTPPSEDSPVYLSRAWQNRLHLEPKHGYDAPTERKLRMQEDADKRTRS